ncbi:PDZ domain-containing protein [Microbulbifer sp. YPW1]|uniref:PDZ domain-containing protein n=1 Tax=Microbulbifer sp. YPW1 TaxID=2745199 RepID=UPI00159B5F5B|nr:PDZ domain-containing protein [Microbulbifer sp. YPW1]QKX18706.1 PDZ domain-containing protein [Microbulbifer sp. YPW1]
MMLRKYTLPLAALSLLAVGAAVGQWIGSDSPSTPAIFASQPGAPKGNLGERVQQLEKTLEQTLKIQGQLLELVNELNSRFEPGEGEEGTRHAGIASTQHDMVSSEPPQNHHQNRYDRMRENQIRQLTEEGFSPERAAFIVDKQERIQYEQMQFSYEYHHMKDKRSPEAKALQEKMQTYSNPRRVFENELTDAEFEQYLQAFGGRTEMEIGDLLDGTPAHEAGLRPGDKIIRYNNERIYHMGDLRTQVYQAKPGTSVEVEIQRKGSSAPETIYLPAGPLGIRG